MMTDRSLGTSGQKFDGAGRGGTAVAAVKPLQNGLAEPVFTIREKKLNDSD